MKDKSNSNKQSIRIVKKNFTKDFVNPKEGAWKLAYADFVTSMMCFFMLMWLLNATPSQKLKSMATYFEPTIGFFSKNTSDNKPKNGNATFDSQDEISTSSVSTQSENLSSTEEKIKSDFTNDTYIKELISNISISKNDDGLEISIFDNNKDPMFKKGSTQLTDEAKMIVERVTRSILYLPNRIVIGGYTEKMDGQSINGFNSWDLSAGRANSTMKIMQISGLPQEKIAKLISYADNVPFDDNEPYSPRNRRITITLLSKWSTVQYKNPISNSAISLEKK